ncbi:MAG: 4Fe-4S binding protein [Methanomassiliicoccales archaeon]
MSDECVYVMVCSWAGGERPPFQVQELVEYAAGLKGVAAAFLIPRLCKSEGREQARALLKNSKANRVVLVGCHDSGFRAEFAKLMEGSGLSPYGLEIANVRELAAYIHPPEAALRKAKAMMAAAVEKMRAWNPPPTFLEGRTLRRVAVIGSGLTATLASRELVAQGLEVEVIVPKNQISTPPSYIFADEKEMKRGHSTLKELEAKVKVLWGKRVIRCEGVPGDFELEMESAEGISRARYGAIILAPEPCLELRDLEGRPVQESRMANSNHISIVVLPGGRSSGTDCSCISPRATLFALKAKANASNLSISLLGRELRAMGKMEALQRQAQCLGVTFYRLQGEVHWQGSGPYEISFQDSLLGPIRLKADLVLRDSITNAEAEELARIFKLPLDDKGDILRMDSRLRPGETVRAGILACRYRLGNMLFEDLEREAAAAAARAAELLKGNARREGALAQVDKEKCSACLSCVRICPYSAPRIGEGGKAEVIPELCQGCGACAPLCPSRAIAMHMDTEEQIYAQTRALLRCLG